MKLWIILFALLTAPSAFAVQCEGYCISRSSQPGMVLVRRLIDSRETLEATETGWARLCARYGGKLGMVTDRAALQDGYDVHLVAAETIATINQLLCY